MTSEQDGGEVKHEVVIKSEGGYDEEHAELLRRRLINDGFHDHVVSVREVEKA